MTWCGTGNNIQLGGDLARRCYLIDMASHVAFPWRRPPDTFRHPDLPSWITEHRAELVWAALTLARSWFAAGCPESSGPVLGRYVEWCKLMGGILEHADVPDFLANLERIYERADTEASEWVALLEAWEADPEPKVAVPTAYIINAISKNHEPWPVPGDVAARLDRAGENSKTSVLGKALARVVGRRFNERGLRVESAGKDGHTKAGLWRVVADGPPGAHSS